jgi:hypothetical protein
VPPAGVGVPIEILEDFSCVLIFKVNVACFSAVRQLGTVEFLGESLCYALDVSPVPKRHPDRRELLLKRYRCDIATPPGDKVREIASGKFVKILDIDFPGPLFEVPQSCASVGYRRVDDIRLVVSEKTVDTLFDVKRLKIGVAHVLPASVRRAPVSATKVKTVPWLPIAGRYASSHSRPFRM